MLTPTLRCLQDRVRVAISSRLLVLPVSRPRGGGQDGLPLLVTLPSGTSPKSRGSAPSVPLKITQIWLFFSSLKKVQLLWVILPRG